MNKRLLIVLSFVLLGMGSYAQQNIWDALQIVSPEIHEDHSVTFRFDAPNADTVFVTGDFFFAEKTTTYDDLDGPGKALLSKNDKGIWAYTTEPLKSDLYSYSFIVDGLKTTDPNNVYMIRDVASIFDVFIVGGGKGDLYSVGDVPHGTVARRWYNSPRNKMQRRITVYTPPGYEDDSEKYPVLYLLHGMGGDEEAWIALGRTAQILDNLIAQGKAKPMIVVMPNGNVAQQAAPGESPKGLYKPSMMLPHTMDGKYEETFSDVIKFVENNYRVVTDKEHRAIAGLSMGGFHSLHISRYYPNTFDYVGLFSAAILPPEVTSSNVYEHIDESLKIQINNGCKLYWIGIGKTDFLYKYNADYRAKLDSMGMKYTYVETEGGHAWTNWRVYLSDFVPLLFNTKNISK